MGQTKKASKDLHECLIIVTHGLRLVIRRLGLVDLRSTSLCVALYQAKENSKLARTEMLSPCAISVDWLKSTHATECGHDMVPKRDCAVALW